MNQVFVFLCIVIAVLSEVSNKHSNGHHHGKDKHHGKNNGHHGYQGHGEHYDLGYGGHNQKSKNHHKKDYAHSLIQDEEAVFNQLKTAIRAAAPVAEEVPEVEQDAVAEEVPNVVVLSVAAPAEAETAVPAEAETAVPVGQQVLVLQLDAQNNVVSSLIPEEQLKNVDGNQNVMVLQVQDPELTPATQEASQPQVVFLQVAQDNLAPVQNNAPAVTTVQDAISEAFVLALEQALSNTLNENNLAAVPAATTEAADNNVVWVLQVDPNHATVADAPVNDPKILSAITADEVAAALNGELVHNRAAKKKLPKKKTHQQRYQQHHQKQHKKAQKKPHYRVFYF